MSHFDQNQLQRILILQSAFLGDVILTLPLLQTVKAHFPEAQVDFLAIPAAGNILETHRDITDLIIFDKRGRDRGAGSFLRLMRRLRRKRYDLALIPHRSIRSALLTAGAGITRRIGFDRSAGAFLFHQAIPYPAGVHEINRNLHLLTPFGVDPQQKVFPRIYFNEADDSALAEWRRTNSIGENEALIAMAPGSVWATKRWIPEEFARLADRLADRYRVVLVGGPADDAVITEIQQQTKSRPLSAAGQLTPRQSALLIRGCRLLVSNDSAPMHLAVAVGTPVVAIFGATVPAFGFYPYGDKDRVVEINGLSCRPCGIHGGQQCPIGTFECMKGIRAEMVYEAVKDVLNRG